MEIALYHKHYNQQHLDEVKSEMITLGAPVIRCIWSECYGMWLAVEGCHRLRAAAELGLTPVIKDVSEQKTISIQDDGETIRYSVTKLLEELNDNITSTETIQF